VSIAKRMYPSSPGAIFRGNDDDDDGCDLLGLLLEFEQKNQN
jgi:hypothetical protein